MADTAAFYPPEVGSIRVSWAPSHIARGVRHRYLVWPHPPPLAGQPNRKGQHHEYEDRTGTHRRGAGCRLHVDPDLGHERVSQPGRLRRGCAPHSGAEREVESGIRGSSVVPGVPSSSSLTQRRARKGVFLSLPASPAFLVNDPAHAPAGESWMRG